MSKAHESRKNENIARARQSNSFFVAREAPVLPLTGKKSPAIKYAKIYSTPAEWLDEWESNARFAKSAGLGLRTGGVSGVTVLDEDVDRTVARLFRYAGEVIPTTTTSMTGSVKPHFYFAYDARLPTTTKILGGIDIRNDGGIIVLPGSVHPDTGGLYEWVLAPEDVGFAVLPEAVVQLILKLTGRDSDGNKIRKKRDHPRAAKQESEDPQPEEDWPGASATAHGGPSSSQSSPLLTNLPDSIPEGERDDTLYRIACGLRARSVPESQATEFLEQVNRERCEPPLDEGTVRAKIESAFKHDPGLSTGWPRGAGTVTQRPPRRVPYRCPLTGVIREGNEWLPSPMSAQEEDRFFQRRKPHIRHVLDSLRAMQRRTPFVRYSYVTLRRVMLRDHGVQISRTQAKHALRVLEQGRFISRPLKRRAQALMQRFYYIQVSCDPRWGTVTLGH